MLLYFSPLTCVYSYCPASGYHYALSRRHRAASTEKRTLRLTSATPHVTFTRTSPVQSISSTLGTEPLYGQLPVRSCPHLCKEQGKRVVLKGDQNLFGHMWWSLLSRADICTSEMLYSTSIGATIMGTSNIDRSLCKTNKAALSRELKKMFHQQKLFQSLQHTSLMEWASSKLKCDGKTFAGA